MNAMLIRNAAQMRRDRRAAFWLGAGKLAFAAAATASITALGILAFNAFRVGVFTAASFNMPL